jgi:hypothetical protein
VLIVFRDIYVRLLCENLKGTYNLEDAGRGRGMMNLRDLRAHCQNIKWIQPAQD